MSLFLMSVQVAKDMEALQIQFFWDGTNNNRKLHLIVWDQVFADKKHDGLDIRGLVSLNFFFTPEMVLTVLYWTKCSLGWSY